MNRKKRLKLTIIQILLVILIVFFVLQYFRYLPYVRKAAEYAVINAASDRIVDAVNEQLFKRQKDFADIIIFEKDANGNITALKTNMAVVNILKSTIMTTLCDKIEAIETDDISVPIGNILLPSLFAGKGAKIPVKVLSLTSSDSSFSSEFSSAGINQTLQSITLTVSMTVLILSPAGKQEVFVSSTVPISQTVIVGTVPNSFVNFNA